MFDDRRDAGQRLGRALIHYRGKKALVLAIPRGGVEVGYYVAEHLGLPLSIVIVRKLPFPDNPEAGFGAVAEDGSTFFVDRARIQVPPPVVEKIVEEQRLEVQRRIDALRKGKPLPKITGRTAILVDDGIAMGSTMRAAIMLCRNRKARTVVVAAPVSGRTMFTELTHLADDVVVLERPSAFRAVAQVYRNWYDVGDDEVIRILRRSEL